MTPPSEQKPRTFITEYPWVFYNTRMYPLSPDNPRAAFVLGPVASNLEDDFPLHVGFCRDCEKRWEMRSSEDPYGTVECAYKDKGTHGHLILVCDDGTAIIQAPVYSRAFLDFLFKQIAAKGILERRECETAQLILKEDIKHLPPELTSFEKGLLTLKEVENELNNLVWVG
jgi:hypothetical protein